MRFLIRILGVCCLVVLGGLLAVWIYAGDYGLEVLFRHGGTYWISIGPNSPQLSPSMRLALRTTSVASPGGFQWRTVAPGFETADLPVTLGNSIVDHILLARVDPARFKFVMYNDPTGTRNLDDWMAQLGAALVVNGSYYARDGKPDTPVLSHGVLLGPHDYEAKAGAFIASPSFTGIRDLGYQDWKTAFRGAENAMVSYPMLVANGSLPVATGSRWLANRSFVGQDRMGEIIIGTTTDAFFSLDRLAQFLRSAPLNLAYALNLDGGPVASQGISLNGYRRMTYGRWEAQAQGSRVRLLTWPYGTVAMPLVLALFPK